MVMTVPSRPGKPHTPYCPTQAVQINSGSDDGAVQQFCTYHCPEPGRGLARWPCSRESPPPKR